MNIKLRALNIGNHPRSQCSCGFRGFFRSDYFDSGKTDVHGDFTTKSADLVNYMKANADTKAVISGFNDPTGNAAANAELSKNRAQAVQAALVAAGIPEDRTVLEKPAETSGTAATNAASRRVEVVLRK